MDINEKMIQDLAGQMGFQGKTAKVAEKFKDKNEDELVDEILNLKKAMKSNPKQFEKQMSAVKSLSSMMNSEQKEKLNKIISMLEKE
ncbi:MAG: hypothetical protein RR131_05415 [Anaerovorax sp.]